jgi:hypothetical protein
MSSYEVGAFEALEWAWNLLRKQGNHDSIEKATASIQDMLYTLGSGDQVNFQQKIDEINNLA